jgi:hypothetical protein
MTAETHAKLPTRAQINAQFAQGRIHESLAKYDLIKNNNGLYPCGQLTVQWYGPNSQWIADVNNKYDADAQQAIVGYIRDFLTAPGGPTPFTINWSNGPKSISKTANTIEIVGYAAPPE